MRTSIRPPRPGAIGAVICATLGCTTATFVPRNVRRIEGEGGSAQLESARLSTDGRLWVRARFAEYGQAKPRTKRSW